MRGNAQPQGTALFMEVFQTCSCLRPCHMGHFRVGK